MTEYYAHTLENRPDDEWQTLDSHLVEVADLAQRFSKEIRPDDNLFADLAKLAGLLHDLGKYRMEFQEYLRKKRQGGR